MKKIMVLAVLAASLSAQAQVFTSNTSSTPTFESPNHPVELDLEMELDARSIDLTKEVAGGAEGSTTIADVVKDYLNRGDNDDVSRLRPSHGNARSFGVDSLTLVAIGDDEYLLRGKVWTFSLHSTRVTGDVYRSREKLVALLKIKMKLSADDQNGVFVKEPFSSDIAVTQDVIPFFVIAQIREQDIAAVVARAITAETLARAQALRD